MSVATQSTPKSTLPPLERSAAGELLAHSLPALAVAHNLAVNTAVGLSSSEVAERRTKYGFNSIQSIRPRPAWRLLVDQFASVVIALLAVAALVAWATSDVIEATAIVVALVGFITEWQAGRALNALRRQTRMTSR
jgi:Ca2+-transporting ATPase